MNYYNYYNVLFLHYFVDLDVAISYTNLSSTTMNGHVSYFWLHLTKKKWTFKPLGGFIYSEHNLSFKALNFKRLKKQLV